MADVLGKMLLPEVEELGFDEVSFMAAEPSKALTAIR